MSAEHEHAREARRQVRPALVIVMGVSGSGKSTLGQELSDRLGVPFRDGDDLHSQDSVDKMSKGIPLTDDDRWPWLHRIRAEAASLTATESVEAYRKQRTHGKAVENPLARPTVVIACSALKLVYRDLLRGRRIEGMSAKEVDGEEGVRAAHSDVQTYFVYLKGSRELLLERMQLRPGHFMKAGMLDSQLKTLEEPTADEDPYGGVIVIELSNSKEEVAQQAETKVRAAVGR